MNILFEKVKLKNMIQKTLFKSGDGFSVTLEYDKITLEKMKVSGHKKYVSLFRLKKNDDFTLTIEISCCLYTDGAFIVDNSYIESFFKPFDFDNTGQYFLSRNMKSIKNIKDEEIDINDLINHLYHEHTLIFRKKVWRAYFQAFFDMFFRGIFFLLQKVFSFFYFISSWKKFSFYKYYAYVDTNDGKVHNHSDLKEETKKNVDIFGVSFSKRAAIIFFVAVSLAYILIYVKQWRPHFLMVISKHNILTISFSVFAIYIIEVFFLLIKSMSRIFLNLTVYFNQKYNRAQYFNFMKTPSLYNPKNNY